MLAALLLISARWQASQHLIGGEGAIRRIAAHHPASAPAADPFLAVRQTSAALRAKIGTLYAPAAADTWIGLTLAWERAASLRNADDSDVPDRWGEIMMPALPAPEAWPLIRDRLAGLPATNRRKAIAALFDDLLGHDRAVLAYLQAKPPADPDLPEEMRDPMPGGAIPIAVRSGDSTLLANTYVKKSGGTWSGDWDGLPDIVRQFGAPAAESVLRRMFEAAKSSLSPFKGAETQTLARAVVTSDLARLKSPQWGPIRGLDDFPLVAAEVAHFGEDRFNNAGYTGNAAMVYVLGLVRRGEVDHAIKLLSARGISNYVDVNRFAEPGADSEACFALVGKLLDRKPEQGLWWLYRALGSRLDRQVEVARRLASILADKNLLPDARAMYLEEQADLDLASGHVPAAVKELEAALALSRKDGRGELVARKLLQIAGLTDDREAV